MAKHSTLHIAFLLISIVAAVSGQNTTTSAKTFTLVNKCQETVWPGIIAKGDNSQGEGFALKPGQTFSHNATSRWSGRIWARTGCNFDKNGNGTCQTGSCGTALNCTEPSSPPNTIAEFTLGDLDFYDVSLVNGFNVPIAVYPLGGKLNCSHAGCDGDLRQSCPSELALKSDSKVIACRSACDAFNTDQYCCTGTYADPTACVPTNYSKTFKQVCPAASSYAFDDRTSVITCSASDYVVAFCASKNQTVCSYQDNKVNCNASNGSGARFQGWRILMLVLPFTAFSQVIL